MVHSAEWPSSSHAIQQPAIGRLLPIPTSPLFSLPRISSPLISALLLRRHLLQLAAQGIRPGQRFAEASAAAKRRAGGKTCDVSRLVPQCRRLLYNVMDYDLMNATPRLLLAWCILAQYPCDPHIARRFPLCSVLRGLVSAVFPSCLLFICAVCFVASENALCFLSRLCFCPS